MHSYLVKDGLYGILVAAEVYNESKHMFDADIDPSDSLLNVFTYRGVYPSAEQSFMIALTLIVLPDAPRKHPIRTVSISIWLTVSYEVK